MNIETQLQEIVSGVNDVKENTPKVYEQGRQDERTMLWEELQIGGTRTDYRTAFTCFTDATYNPIYEIRGSLESTYAFNTGLTSTKNILIKPTGTANSLFRFATKIRTIPRIDITNASIVTDMFRGTDNLVEIRFEGEIPKTLSLISCAKLSTESIQNIIDHLATVETAQTITFHTTVVGKLTDEQAFAIGSKNWQIG